MTLRAIRTASAFARSGGESERAGGEAEGEEQTSGGGFHWRDEIEEPAKESRGHRWKHR